jgi:hypothetical protein
MTIDDMNLDAMSGDDLMAIWSKSNSVKPVSFARELFPTKPKGYVRATKDLGNYASNKATAMQCRLAGNIQTAIMYEDIADRIYDNLPEYAKW